MAHLVTNGAVPDLVKWLTSPNGIYSTLSGSNALSPLTLRSLGRIWFGLGMFLGLSFILWLAIYCKLSTMDLVILFSAQATPV
jgi:hypothetical protein